MPLFGGLGSAMLPGGLDNLKGLFQTRRFYVTCSERSPEWFCVLYHIFPCTSLSIFLLWPLPSISFLKVMELIATLSDFVLLLLIIFISCRASMSLINCSVFVCLDPKWNLSFLNLRNEKCPSGRGEFSPGLRTGLFFAMEIPNTKCICLSMAHSQTL